MSRIRQVAQSTQAFVTGIIELQAFIRSPQKKRRKKKRVRCVTRVDRADQAVFLVISSGDISYLFVWLFNKQALTHTYKLCRSVCAVDGVVPARPPSCLSVVPRCHRMTQNPVFSCSHGSLPPPPPPSLYCSELLAEHIDM